MRSSHIVKRGKRYQFMCRIPVDIQPLFPHSKIYKSLNTSDEKVACQLATAMEYHTQKLFFQLRTGMLEPNVKKYLISQYLHDYLQFIERDMYGGVPPAQEPETSKDRVRLKKLVERKNFTLKLLDNARSKTNMGRDNYESVQNWADNIDTWLKDARESLALRKTYSVEFCKVIERRIAHFNSRVEKKKDKIVLSDDEKKLLHMDFLRAEIQALEVYKAASIGELTAFDSLKESVNTDLNQCAIIGMTFSKVIKEYMEYYENSKHNVKVGTLKDMKVECEMLLDIIGDININKVNTMGTLTKLKKILLKYPRNKKQKYGDKPIHDILKTQTNYAIISNKTANEPLKRIVNIIDYAIKSDYVLSANKYNKELFDVDKTNKPRKSYDKNDIEKLVDAICTKPLWIKKPSKDDRFWVILIALLHGFRLGNIVNITKKHIIQDENGWHCFDLRLFQEEELLKTVNASMLVPIHGCLLLLGFMTWVERSKSVRLFSDTSKSFSAWYNRRDKSSLGFETRYVTDDPDKCLHSSRHYFSNELQRGDVEHKMIQEMMGHARIKNDVTNAHYLDRSDTSKMKEAHDKMKLVGLDLNRLEVRANELFGLAE